MQRKNSIYSSWYKAS